MDDRLYRSRTDRMIAGVAGGLAERYDMDPALVRIAWALLILGTGGLFFLLYIVMAIVVPEDPLDAATPAAPMGAQPPMTDTVALADTTDSGGRRQGLGRRGDGPRTHGRCGSRGSAGSAAAPAPAMSAREARRAARGERRDSNAPMIFGAVLVIIGVVAFAGQVFPQLDFDLIWPIGLIVLGGALVLGATRRSS